MSTAVIVDAVRTASGRGKPGGALSFFHPVDLLGTVLRGLVDRTGLDPAMLDDVIGGCLSQVGAQSGNLTRAAVLAAGFPESVPATTVASVAPASRPSPSRRRAWWLAPTTW
jgi:acetyl-CoA acyltransferase